MGSMGLLEVYPPPQDDDERCVVIFLMMMTTPYFRRSVGNLSVFADRSGGQSRTPTVRKLSSSSRLSCVVVAVIARF